MTTPNPTQPSRLVRLSAVLARVGLSRSFWYGAVSRGEAPAPIKIGRASVWDSRAIDTWIDAQRDRSGRAS